MSPFISKNLFRESAAQLPANRRSFRDVKFRVFCICTWAILLSVSCRERRGQILPEESFSIFINVNEPSFFDLSVPSGWVYYNGNTVDLIIYRNTPEEFTALDARSTYNINEACMVEVTDDNITIEDPCSGSTWLIMDGSLQSGPATLPLVRYDTEFNPLTGELHIFN